MSAGGVAWTLKAGNPEIRDGWGVPRAQIKFVPRKLVPFFHLLRSLMRTSKNWNGGSANLGLAKKLPIGSKKALWGEFLLSLPTVVRRGLIELGKEEGTSTSKNRDCFGTPQWRMAYHRFMYHILDWWLQNNLGDQRAAWMAEKMTGGVASFTCIDPVHPRKQAVSKRHTDLRKVLRTPETLGCPEGFQKYNLIFSDASFLLTVEVVFPYGSSFYLRSGKCK